MLCSTSVSPIGWTLLLGTRMAHIYKAEGPTTDARNADTTPEPLPTSKHTHGLKTVKRQLRLIKLCVCLLEIILDLWLTSSAVAGLRLSPEHQSGGRSPPPARKPLGSLLVQRGNKAAWGSSYSCSLYSSLNIHSSTCWPTLRNQARQSHCLMFDDNMPKLMLKIKVAQPRRRSCCTSL